MANVRFGWMDSIHYEHHLEGDRDPQPVYVSDESCREHETCIDTDGYCTSMRVAVMPAEEYERNKEALRIAAETLKCVEIAMFEGGPDLRKSALFQEVVKSRRAVLDLETKEKP